MAGAGQACVTLGALAALVGVIMGVVFMLNEEFVVANMQCNPAAAGALTTSAICVDGLVTIGGETCQIGNLGLYTASFTPECLDSTLLAITPAVTRGPSPTTEFPPLFPAQTGLAGTAAAVGVDLGDFESCAATFADTNAAVAGVLTILSIGGAQDSFFNQVVGLPAALKGGYDAGVDQQFADLSALLFAGFAQTTIDLLESLGAPAIPANVDDAYLGQPNVIAGLGLLPASAARDGLVAALTIGNATGATTTFTAAQIGYAQGTSDFPNPLGGIAAGGLYAPFNSAILCSPAATCTYLDHIENIALLLTSVGDDRLDAASAILGALELAVLADSGLANRTELEEDAASVSQTAADLAGQIQLVKDFISLGETVPTGDWINTAALLSQGGSSNYPFLCGGVGLAPTCTFQQFINATFDSLSNSADPADQAQAQSLSLAAAIVNSCLALDGLVNVSNAELCIQNGLAVPNPTPLALVTFRDVLGNLYSGIDTDDPNLLSSTLALDAAEAECNLDEQDLAAISQAQVLFPAGVALSGVGLFVAIVNLALFAGSNMSKYVGLVAGVLSLVGLILAVVALLGVYNAPIYASLGAPEGETPDGEQLFSSGIGFIYVLVSLAGAGLGAVLITIGALFLKVEDPAVDIMKA